MAATRTTGAAIAGRKDFQHLQLDRDKESLTLLSILRAFDGPINEERAWAVLYQSAKAALQCFSANTNHNNNNNQQVQIVQQQLADLSVAAQNSQNAPASATAPGSSVVAESRTRFIEPSDTGQQIASLNETIRCCVVSETSQLWIHRDGHVHSSSFKVPSHVVEDEGRTVANGQNQLVAGLGWALFEALDYGCKREEQNVLSPDLEQIIDLMTSADDEVNNAGGESQSAEDEGIERDSDEMDDGHQRAPEEASRAGRPEAAALDANESHAGVLSLAQVMDRCRMQISSAASELQADNHFRAVCRALVAETLEFSDFLVKVSSEPEEWRELRSKAELRNTPELAALHLADWAKLWVQVIRQLRNGVKLKARAESARKPIEYELTPYEMMMDDIRSRRYKLRQVMVDGNIPPRVKKDAHAVILEFIRSRPPLRKASERTLRPARRVSTPVELLMESIRKHDSQNLRPTRSLMRDRTEFSPAAWGVVTAKRKLLKADQFNPDAEDDDDDDLLPPPSPPLSRFEAPEPSVPAAEPEHRRHSSVPQHRDASPRRHSITVIPAQVTRTLSASFVKSQSHNSHLSSYAHNGPAGGQPDPRIRLVPAHLTDGSLPCSGASSSASSVSSVSLPSSPPGSPMHPGCSSLHLQDDFVRSEEFQQVVQGKLVTLEELVHMRRVLTAASLENLPLESSVKDDVINGKVCFVCRKTRFSVFGAWWHGCKLCRRTVCTKCCVKMRIPSDRFDTVAVSELSWPDKQPVPYSAGPPSSPGASPSPGASLFSGLGLKLPQFRLHSPGAGSCSSLTPPSPPASGPSSGAESSPSSPVFARRGSERRKNAVAAVTGRFVQQSLAQHQSLSASSTPVRTPERKTSAVEGHVCRDCQSLIEHITYNPVRTLHRPHQNLLQPPVVGEHCSLP